MSPSSISPGIDVIKVRSLVVDKDEAISCSSPRQGQKNKIK